MEVESEKLSVGKPQNQSTSLHYSLFYPVSPSSTLIPTIPFFVSIQSTDDMPLTVRSMYHQNINSSRAGIIVHLRHYYILSPQDSACHINICSINMLKKKKENQETNPVFMFSSSIFFIILFRYVTSVKFIPPN